MTPALTPLPVSAVWGGCEIRTGDPGTATHEDVVVAPFSETGPWGVFSGDGSLILEAADRVDPEGRLQQPAGAEGLDLDGAVAAPDEELIYGGRLHSHYGHFVIESLARLWPFAGGRRTGARLLFVAAEAKAELFRQSYTAAALAAVGFGEADVLVAERPMRVRRLIVPHASYQQQAFAYTAFRKLCLGIGLAVRADGAPVRGIQAAKRRAAERLSRLHPDTPLYLSKRWLTSGVRRIANEAEVEAVLQAGGVHVFHPELSPFPEQLELLARRRVVLGSAGSALHTTIFGPAPSRLLVVSPEPQLNSNFRIFDRLTGVRASYFQAQTEAAPLEAGQQFALSYRFTQPADIARELLRLV